MVLGHRSVAGLPLRSIAARRAAFDFLLCATALLCAPASAPDNALIPAFQVLTCLSTVAK
jgi:hypothetical protein